MVLLQIKFNKLTYFLVGLVYVGIVLFLVSITVGTSLADNATIDYKAELISVIVTANDKLDNAVVGTVSGQYPQSAIDAFELAIGNAQKIVDNQNVSTEQVDQAVVDLKNAGVIFDKAKIATVNKAALTSAISSASSKANNAVVGTASGQYPQSAIDSFKSAINKAQAVAVDASATQAEVNKAVTDLKSAEATFDAARITNGGSTPPASVTNLKDRAVGSTWIRWAWTNPTDSDFSHVMVYIDNSFVTTTFNNYYELSGLVGGTTHTIGLKTVDTSGNINSELIVDSATTITTNTVPEITNVAGNNITTTTIKIVWVSSNDTSSVKIRRNNVFLSIVTESTYYVDSGLEAGTTYSYSLLPYSTSGVEGKAVNVSLKTKSSSKSGGGSSGSSSSKKSSSSGGGSGATSVEDFVNVAIRDVDSAYLKMDSNVIYEFSREGNDIQSISLYSLKNSGEITSTIEVLNDRSKLAHSNPDGLVYRYLNIWVGKAGFATSNNIKDARIKFKVNNSWIEETGVIPAEIKLQRYNGTAWEVLPTTLESSNVDYTVFEAQTPGFSPFAITAEKTFAVSTNGNVQSDVAHVEDIGLEGTQPVKSNVWTYIMAIILVGMLAVGYEYLKKEN
ncbi:PGF-pre-PGF domain-containing protein [uncultured Methanomethylovorans sp.]|uniref:PGF-pre-PGF domain-containing protein n=1 Tax=uncultured Methanomethylovorans sp. TaxID=183759 RepID=UPI002AA77F82|nr:PGF-pre-PGF domain-containing protein [uncultured Methanomethylovorans sp.]